MSATRAAQVLELRGAMQRMFRRFGALASDRTPCGKPLSMAHAHALMILLATGEQSQQELGAALCIDKSNVARLCARMVEMEHVTQNVSDEDARRRRVALTAKGARLAREVDESSTARFATLLHAVPAGKRADVIAALDQLVLAMEELP